MLIHKTPRIRRDSTTRKQSFKRNYTSGSNFPGNLKNLFPENFLPFPGNSREFPGNKYLLKELNICIIL